MVCKVECKHGYVDGNLWNFENKKWRSRISLQGSSMLCNNWWNSNKKTNWIYGQQNIEFGRLCSTLWKWWISGGHRGMWS